MKISKPLEWIRPFIEDVADLAPVYCLEKIVGLHPKENKVQRQLARYTRTLDGKRHYISMNLYYWGTVSLNPTVRKKMPFTKIDFLEHLAHELAHLVHWEHDAEHLQLQSQILVRFSKRLHAEGYVAED